VWLRATGWKTGVRLSAVAGNFLFSATSIPARAHPASHPVGTGSFFPGISVRGLKLTTHHHAVPTSRIVDLTSTLPHVFMSWYLIKQAWGQLYHYRYRIRKFITVDHKTTRDSTFIQVKQVHIFTIYLRDIRLTKNVTMLT
jgi:hypothetical protein